MRHIDFLNIEVNEGNCKLENDQEKKKNIKSVVAVENLRNEQDKWDHLPKTPTEIRFGPLTPWIFDRNNSNQFQCENCLYFYVYTSVNSWT